VRIADFPSARRFFFSGLGGVLALRISSMVRLRTDGSSGDGVRGTSFELLGCDVKVGEAGAEYKLLSDESGVLGRDIDEGGLDGVFSTSVSVSSSLRITFLWRIIGPLGNCAWISETPMELLLSESSTKFGSNSTAKVNLYP